MSTKPNFKLVYFKCFCSGMLAVVLVHILYVAVFRQHYCGF